MTDIFIKYEVEMGENRTVYGRSSAIETTARASSGQSVSVRNRKQVSIVQDRENGTSAGRDSMIISEQSVQRWHGQF